jgi:hypothetical protein
MKGWGVARRSRHSERENLCRLETQGRYPHEIRREGIRAERNVKRLRKPEGVAQPVEVIPVLVAACFCTRRRVRNPMGGCFR